MHVLQVYFKRKSQTLSSLLLLLLLERIIYLQFCIVRTLNPNEGLRFLFNHFA